MFSTAFQADAFQNDAFQIAGAPPADTGKSGVERLAQSRRQAKALSPWQKPAARLPLRRAIEEQVQERLNEIVEATLPVPAPAPVELPPLPPLADIEIPNPPLLYTIDGAPVPDWDMSGAADVARRRAAQVEEMRQQMAAAAAFARHQNVAIALLLLGD
jgi:hypothetical protein